MGEVYRARDTRLGRDVAIKVLPPSVAMDEDRRARFDREAQTVAALSHPHIVAVFDTGIHDGQAFVVMELLEGETLRERLTTGAMPVRKVIDCGVQIAKGLAAAHDKGLVHRDLKPDNIFMLADGHVKILDFGLARATSEGAGSGATETVAALTDPGQVMGTMGYMAPEQIRGRQVDGRADLFAFGAVLYEMATGTRAFQRDTPADTMTAILKEDPPELLAVRADLPASLDRIIRHCLEKIPAERFQSARDVAFALESLSGSASSPTASGSLPAAVGSGSVAARPAVLRERIAWGLAAMALIAASATWWTRPTPALAPVSRFKIPIDVSSTAFTVNLAVAPDGHAIVLHSQWQSGDRRLQLRRLDVTEVVPLPGTDGATVPFWSPDSASIGFVADGVLKRYDFSSSSVRTIAPVGDLVVASAAWGRSEVILVGGINGPLRSVPAAGGVVTPLGDLNAASGEISQLRPQFLPDGQRFVYRSRREDGSASVLLRSLDSADTRTLFSDDAFVTWAGRDHVIYRREDAVYAQAVDWSVPALLGGATTLSTDVDNNTVFRESASDTGVLAFVYRSNRQQQFAWYSRSGSRLASVGEPGEYTTFDLSNDGTRIAAARRSGSATNLWTIDTERGTSERITLGPVNDVDPRWSSDALSVIFGSLRDSARSPFKVGLASDSPKLLWKFDGQIFSLDDWSRDGRWLVYHDARVPVLYAREMDPGGAPKGDPVVAARALTGVIDQGQMSPDNRWVAFNSNETGQHEVYVTPFPPTGARVTVSRDGGAQPLWKADGRELYFLGRDGLLKASAISVNGTTLTASAPENLFRPILPGVSVATEQYFPHPSGTKFLTLEIVGNERTLAIGVVLNWPSLIPRPASR